mmetsp:Transcript_167908/g.408072  ORF Transcript_167908/g.408072 Transcript_167908/m.408072 type:complete len:200 (-) Transcript_167908:46-645(-)
MPLAGGPPTLEHMLALSSSRPSRYARHDFHQEAQDLLPHQRPLAPPKPGASPRPVSSSLGASGSLSARQPAAAVLRAAQEAASAALPGGPAGREPGRLRATSERRRNRRVGAGGGAGLTIRPEWLMQAKEAAEQPDYKRRSVFLAEQRQNQGRWPAEARWAGHTPDFIKERHDRLGTLANERGDGRTLPHERPEKWYWH